MLEIISSEKDNFSCIIYKLLQILLMTDTAQSNKRKRYTPEEKAKVVNWVNEYNANHGRGGVANASKEFNVTQLTISNWVKKTGGSISIDASKNVASPDTLRALADVVEEIAVKEEELKTLQKRYNSLAKKV